MIRLCINVFRKLIQCDVSTTTTSAMEVEEEKEEEGVGKRKENLKKFK